ncbi:hypothetical protein KP13_04044 [Klebsiella pneumoniae subsp. pneumoniae Kp13]|nr:hypothetical protein KP13_04044 [Klebsiella pneumoniae subsp. pneumoniae Kp13]
MHSEWKIKIFTRTFKFLENIIHLLVYFSSQKNHKTTVCKYKYEKHHYFTSI